MALGGCVATDQLQLDRSPIPAGLDAHSHYRGTVTLEGMYELLEDGEACFIPAQRRLGDITLPPTARLCFSDEGNAERKLGIASAVAAVDTDKICGIEGHAKIVISDLFVGSGPATDWYTTKLLSVISAGPASEIACGG